jgi:hypothetical protein
MATFATIEPRVPQVQVRGDHRPVLSLAVKSESLLLDAAGSRPAPFVFARDYSKKVIEAFHSSACLSAVVSEAEPHELEAKVLVRRSVENRVALLNLATAYLIPGVEDREIAVEVDLRDLASSREIRAKRSYQYRVWYELLFLPIHPFFSPAAFDLKLSDWLIRATTGEALQKMLNPDVSDGVS